ncbi:MAG: ABC transporter ATP-binding protein [Candidatus Thermoplasmatota archaeon]|nr:ABC transporter ATP-binding protein [Candidatus Thermoplasmatota archaeon]
MADKAIELIDVSFRHRIASPKFTNPWHTRKGPGIFGLNFSLNKGEIMGLVGPNGAGKTTLLRILAGVMPIDEGQIKINDLELSKSGDAVDTQLRTLIGHMPEQVRWSGSTTVYRTIEDFANMRQSPTSTEKLLKLVGLSTKSNASLDELSQGMRQRLSLAIAMMGAPQILLLDEPFNGLDPVAAKSVEKMIKQLTKRGVSIIISSHQVSGLVGLIDKLLLIHRGQIVADGTIEAIETKLGLENRIELQGIGKSPDLPKYIGSGEIIEHSDDGESWNSIIQNPDEDCIQKIINAGHNLIEWKRKRPDIVELLCQATGLEIEEIGMEVQSSNMMPYRTVSEEE